jgi:hypothetical protein
VVKKKIFNTLIICFLCFSHFNIYGQVYYENSEASFEVSEDNHSYYVKCRLTKNIQGSRTLQLALNRIRLKAVDLVGNYIIFKQLKLDLQPKNDFFEAFVNYSNLNYNADIESFSGKHWRTCDNTRCVDFECNKDDYIVSDNFVLEQFDMKEMLLLDFRRKKTIRSACVLLELEPLNLGQYIEIERLFLRGNAQINESISNLLKTNPNYQLENSLFGNDSVMELIAENIQKENNTFCDFGMIVLSKILFTSINNDKKNIVYSNYLNYISRLDGDWYKMQSFAAKNRDKLSFPSFSEATVFDVIEAYPGALNIYGLNIVSVGQNYQLAIEAFSNSNFDAAIELLRNEIDLNGVSSEALNLVGACYNQLDTPAKALPFLILALNINIETTYLAGNLCLCLKYLGYNDINEISEYFLNTVNIDAWSEQQIRNIDK